MIIWTGTGILILFVFGLFYFLTGIVLDFGENLIWMRLAISLFGTALIWFGIGQKAKDNLRRAEEAELMLAGGGEMDKRERKRAELYIQMKKSAQVFVSSSLFFIPAQWWSPILATAALLALILHFLLV